MSATFPQLQPTTFPAIRRGRLETLQVNVGYVCNQTCFHCHVNAGPNRKEKMDRATADLVLDYLRHSGARTLTSPAGRRSSTRSSTTWWSRPTGSACR